MNIRPVAHSLLALAVGAAGGGIAWQLGLPAPWLIGATLLVTPVGLLGLRAKIPKRLRDAGFTVIGLSIGSGIDASIIDRLVGWLPSLAAVVASCILIMALSSRLLIRYGGLDPATAKLATSPGALGYALSLALEGRGELAPVMMLQSSRLLAMTTLLPFALLAGGLPAPTFQTPLAPLATLALVVAALPIGRLWEAWAVPASYLLGGIVVSAIAHLTGSVIGGMPRSLTIPVYVVTGTVIGLRFAGQSLASMKRLLPAAAATVTVAIGIAAAFAAGLTLATGVPFANALVALAPGGTEVMAAMALALGIDPTFVAAHHVLRIFFLCLTMPLWLGPAHRPLSRR